MFVLAKHSAAFLTCGTRPSNSGPVAHLRAPVCRCRLSRSVDIPGSRKVGISLHRSSDRSSSVTAKAQAGSQGLAPEGDNTQPEKKSSGGPWFLLAFVIALAVGAAFVMSSPTTKDLLLNGPLGKSGFLAAFSLIFLSEIGDKTFFIAAILAAKLGRWMSFFGSLASLGLMTCISVLIGVVVGRVPDALKSSIPVGEIAGVLLLVFFGVRALRDGLKQDENHGKADDEQAEAEKSVKQLESSGRVSRRSPMQSFVEVATLVFLAEWGDRSMLATIALGASQNPYGVAVGATAGHALATGVAVVGGAIASKYVSEKTINITSGILFLVFAVATAYSLL